MSAPYAQTLNRSVARFEALYLKSKAENVQLIDRKGNLIGEANRGTSRGVSLNKAQKELAMAGKASASIHNHPNNVPIWIGDVKMVRHYRLSRVIVVTEEGRSEFVAPRTGWGDSSTVMKGEHAWNDTMGKKVSSAKYGHESGYLALCHRANEAVAKATGWKYRRKERTCH